MKKIKTQYIQGFTDLAHVPSGCAICPSLNLTSYSFLSHSKPCPLVHSWADVYMSPRLRLKNNTYAIKSLDLISEIETLNFKIYSQDLVTW